MTATIPLALLNQVPAAPFDWLIPGMLVEKVIELIRSLPKAIRTKLVPAPEFAAKAITIAASGCSGSSVLETIASQLGKLIGEIIPVSSFDTKSLPPHLVMNIRVVDTAGKTVAMGRDLIALRGQLGIQARGKFCRPSASGIYS